MASILLKDHTTGAKPNSPFGFLHNLGSLQRQMVEECDRQYPALREDINRLEDKPGVVAYLFNTLIDMETLGYGVRKMSPLELDRVTGSTHTAGAGPEDGIGPLGRKDDELDAKLEARYTVPN